MSLLTCGIVCGEDLGAFFHLTLSEQNWAASVHLYHCSDITFAVRTIGSEPFNGSEVGTGWCGVTCFLIKPLITIKDATKFFYYNTQLQQKNLCNIVSLSLFPFPWGFCVHLFLNMTQKIRPCKTPSFLKSYPVICQCISYIAALSSDCLAVILVGLHQPLMGMFSLVAPGYSAIAPLSSIKEITAIFSSLMNFIM